ncbi:dienelactone hydrolase family protein [Dactylosporangium sp. CA-052675]|uniref:dienelactone hydrolase family protein n=1 Tax=Dactylosporangium sp. CA-052675 TaxID=3239927 RepID=UPI003D89E6F4
MNDYLTSEVVVDYADGLINRREALRRLSLMGVGAALAASMLAACTDPAPGPGASASASAPASAAGPAPLPTEPIAFDGLQAAWAAAANPRGAVLVIHENRGLTDHIRSVAGRLAASGFSALALDLLSEEGGTARFTDPAQATAALNAADPARFIEDMRSALDELQRRAPAARLAATGFCFGGGEVWQLLAAGEPRLAAAAPFYGPFPDAATLNGSKQAAVLGIYGELDSRVNATRGAAEAALSAAGMTHELVTFPGANHAFFNDTGERYNATAAAEAYTRLVQWFTEHLA